MIIVEGPDGGGKTHLVESLLGIFPGLKLAPKSVDKKTNPMVDLATYAERSLEELKPVIYDRHPLISEPIYCAALRNMPKDGFDSLPWLIKQEVKFARLRPFVIYCLPSLVTVHHNVWNDTSNPNDAVQDKADVIWGMYAARAAREASLGLALIHDYEQAGSLDRICAMLRAWMQERYPRSVWKP